MKEIKRLVLLLITGTTISSAAFGQAETQNPSFPFWKVNGNTGTVNGTNYIGTADNQHLDIRTNNIIHTRIRTNGQIEVLNTGQSVFVGEGAGLNDDLTTNKNVAIGYNAFNANVTGVGNVGIGYTALQNTTANSNTAVGYQSMPTNTTGTWNSAFGQNTLAGNTSGHHNTALGGQALVNNLTGSYNIAIGMDNMFSHTSGDNNVTIGTSAGGNNVSGSGNIFLGYSAGQNELGSNALYIDNSNTTTPLIYGNLSTNSVMINDSLISKYFKMSNGATNNYVLKSDATGNGSWVDPNTLVTATSDWHITGNSGTNSGTNFIGTTDNVSLRFRTNNTERMVIDSNGTVGIGTTVTNSLSTLTTNRLELWDANGGRSDITVRVAGGGYAGLNFLGHTGTFAAPTATAANAILGQIVGNSRTNAGAYASTSAIQFFVDGTPGASDAPGSINFLTTGTGSTSVTQRMVIDHNGRVAINTTAPITTFAVNGNALFYNGNSAASTAKDQLLFSFNSTTDYRHSIRSRHNGGADAGNALDFFVWDFGTDASTTTGTKRVMTIDGNASGGVGIRTANPTTSLEVVGKTKTDSIQIVAGAANTYILQSDASGNGSWVNPNTIGGYWTASGTHIYNNNTGNVGIGTAAPTQKLEVVGTTKTTNFQMTSGATNTYILQSDAAGNGTWVNPSALATTNYWTASGSNIYNNNPANVGIGTNSPTQQLDVDGTGLFRNGNNNVGTTANQILFSYNGTSDYRHAINTRHNGGGASGNAFDFYIWKQGTDASTTTGTLRAMTIDGNVSGSVGIGTSTPTEKLSIISADNTGTTHIATLTANNLSQGIGIGYDHIQKTGSNANSNLYLDAKGNGGIYLNSNTTGGVCVATVTGGEMLNVGGNIMLTNTDDRSIYVKNSFADTGRALSIMAGDGNGFNTTIPEPGGDLNLFAGKKWVALSGWQSAYAGNVTIRSGGNTESCTGCPTNMGGSIIFQIGQNNNTQFEAARFSENGYLGIGTNNPGFPLEVSTSVNTSYSSYGYVAGGGAGYFAGSSGSVPVAIRASGRIVCPEFDALSDVRIKHILGRSNNKEDLQTINSVGITNYHYIDTIGKGNRVMKKVIAQELEKIYPNAVNTMTDVIPNIYAMADINCGVVNIKNDLKKGDKVQLIFEKRKDIFEVLEANANSFRVNNEEDGNVFVFGKQVDDFRTVDYEALTTLAISAIQQLSKENDELKRTVSTLSNDVDAIKNVLNMKASVK